MRTELLLATKRMQQLGGLVVLPLYLYDLRLCSQNNKLFNVNYFKLFFQSFFLVQIITNLLKC